jgi:NAD(P)-dependent dehydrogenase (short-subunit alcohol dehydrogenase family)
VNSAAIFEPGTLADTDPERWDRHLDINLKSPAFLCREFAGQLAREQTGHIVNLLDWRALRPGTGHLAYTVSKGALATLTRALARELGPQIQVNGIAPGAILPAPGDSQERFESVGRATPLQRTGRPVDVADALVYLLKSEFVTGEILHVTGGQEI